MTENEKQEFLHEYIQDLIDAGSDKESAEIQAHLNLMNKVVREC